MKTLFVRQNSSQHSYGALEVEVDNDGNTANWDFDNKNCQKCTVFETTSNLISVITGSGLLALPFAAKSMGWSALLLLSVVASIFLYAFSLVAESIDGAECDTITHTILAEGQSEVGYFSQGQLSVPYMETSSSISFRNELSKSNSKLEHSQSQRKVPDTGEEISWNYSSLGLAALGPGGDTIVMVVLITEMFLALVSFFINIGLNAHMLDARVSVSCAISIAAFITVVLVNFDLKLYAYASALGVAMTWLIVVAIVATGAQIWFTDIKDSKDSYAKGAGRVGNEGVTASFLFFDVTGLPLALGLIAFCFGGHGTL